MKLRFARVSGYCGDGSHQMSDTACRQIQAVLWVLHELKLMTLRQVSSENRVPFHPLVSHIVFSIKIGIFSISGHTKKHAPAALSQAQFFGSTDPYRAWLNHPCELFTPTGHCGAMGVPVTSRCDFRVSMERNTERNTSDFCLVRARLPKFNGAFTRPQFRGMRLRRCQQSQRLVETLRQERRRKCRSSGFPRPVSEFGL